MLLMVCPLRTWGGRRHRGMEHRLRRWRRLLLCGNLLMPLQPRVALQQRLLHIELATALALRLLPLQLLRSRSIHCWRLVHRFLPQGLRRQLLLRWLRLRRSLHWLRLGLLLLWCWLRRRCWRRPSFLLRLRIIRLHWQCPVAVGVRRRRWVRIDRRRWPRISSIGGSSPLRGPLATSAAGAGAGRHIAAAFPSPGSAALPTLATHPPVRRGQAVSLAQIQERSLY